MSTQLTLLEYLQQRSGGQAYPVALLNPESFDEDAQDALVSPEDIEKKATGETQQPPRDQVRNVAADGGMDDIVRSDTVLRYFLDGCRRAYYICDLATPDGSMLPILAGQYSMAILERNRDSGKVSLLDYERKVALLLPTGGHGLPESDAREIAGVVGESFSSIGMEAEFVEVRNQAEPRQNSLAYLNKIMQALEIAHLQKMTEAHRLGQRNLIVVDGALQFQNVRDERRYLLNYAIGVAKRFKLKLTGVTGKHIQVGTHILRLKRVGDRTVAFRTKEKDKRAYAFWYLRIHPLERMTYPYAGIVKVEKVLVDERDLAHGLSTDVIDNISRYVLLERSVTPYGLDHRWASHIYPVYLTEQLQKQKFLSDYVFGTILTRKVVNS